MREILFRGKRTDNGEWSYGDLITLTTRKDICGIKEISLLGLKTLCDKTTLGQYTGLVDKNGVKIFEGDIVKVVDRGQTNTCDYLERLPDLLFEVACSEENAQFRLINRVERYANDFQRYNTNQLEVIGNVYDNPELLKGGENNA